MIDEFGENAIGGIDLSNIDINRLSPLVLAYIGDAVFELYIRTYLVSSGYAPVHKLHMKSIGYVKARAQALIAHRITEMLTEDEKDVLRRGRNAKSGTVPKNADVGDYRFATGFESLIGYLYLKKDYKRLNKILELSVLNAHE